MRVMVIVKATKEFERLMEGYHDLIDTGHREIYRLETATKG